MTPEGQVKKRIKARLKEIGAYQFWPVQMGMGKRTVDCLCCYKGFFFAIEAKRPGEKPTAHQERVLSEVYKSGGFIVSEDSEGVESLNKMLRKIEVTADLLEVAMDEAEAMYGDR